MKDFERISRRNVPPDRCSTVYMDSSYFIHEDDSKIFTRIFLSRRGEACGLRCLRPGMVTNILFSLDLSTTDWVLEKTKGHPSASLFFVAPEAMYEGRLKAFERPSS